MSCCFGSTPASNGSATATVNEPKKPNCLCRIWKKIASVFNRMTMPETLFYLGLGSIALGGFVAVNLRGVEGFAFGVVCFAIGVVLILGAGASYGIRKCFGCNVKPSE